MAIANPTSQFVDAIDSHYQAVKARILLVNPDRKIKGLLEAQDWPPEKIKEDAFYLLTLGDMPVGGTIGNPVLAHQLQWVWVTIGDPLVQGVGQANRGTRFRTANVMKGELVQAIYPNFTEKKTWTLDATGKWIGVSLNPPEFCWWGRLEFMHKANMRSGHIYNAASVKLTNMLDQIVS